MTGGKNRFHPVRRMSRVFVFLSLRQLQLLQSLFLFASLRMTAFL